MPGQFGGLEPAAGMTRSWHGALVVLLPCLWCAGCFGFGAVNRRQTVRKTAEFWTNYVATDAI